MRKLANLGNRTFDRNVSCPKCGRVWKRFTERLTVKDEDSFKCDCQHVLEKWKTTQMPSFELVS